MKRQTHKFRCWSREEKKWLDPKDFAIAGNGLLIRYNQYPEDRNSPDGWSKTYAMDRFVVQQWTGLVDRSGVDVFEGDIVEWEDWDNGWGHESDPVEKGKGVVEFGHMAYGGYTNGWYIRNFENAHSIGLGVQRLKVIGNNLEKKV